MRATAIRVPCANMSNGEYDSQEYDEGQGGQQELISYQEVTSAPERNALGLLNF
jgi:hypothetical protein